MSIAASLPQLPAVAASAPLQAVARDADFDARWAAWLARGRMHEQRVRQRLLILGSLIAIGAAVGFSLVGS